MSIALVEVGWCVGDRENDDRTVLHCKMIESMMDRISGVCIESTRGGAHGWCPVWGRAGVEAKDVRAVSALDCGSVLLSSRYSYCTLQCTVQLELR